MADMALVSPVETDRKVIWLYNVVAFAPEPGGVGSLMVEEEELLFYRGNAGAATATDLLFQDDDFRLGNPGGVAGLTQVEALGHGEGLGIAGELLAVTGLLGSFGLLAESRKEVVEQVLSISGGGSG